MKNDNSIMSKTQNNFRRPTMNESSKEDKIIDKNKNYNLETKIEYNNKKVIGKDELNAILFKLKGYYNELNTMRTKGEERILNIKRQNMEFSGKVKEIEEMKDIELPNTNIIITFKNQGNFFEPKEKIESRIKYLLAKKKELTDNLNVEKEYTNTLNHMIDEEKKKIENIDQQISEFEEKIEALKLANKNLNDNEIEHDKKMRNYLEVKNQLSRENEKLDKVITFQNESINSLNKELKEKEEIVSSKKLNVKALEANLKIELEKKKNQVLKQIEESKNLSDSSANKENYYIKLILGLSVINEHFIKNFKNNSLSSFENFNEKNVIESNDYIKFLSNKFEVNDEYFSEEEERITENEKDNPERMNRNIPHSERSINLKNVNGNEENNDNSKIRQFNTSIKTKTGESVKKNNSFIYDKPVNVSSKSIRKSTLNVNHIKSENEIVTYLNVNEILKKLSDINITFEDLYNFYSKLNSQITHYQNAMMIFNQKLITLETKKDSYTIQVKEILKKNYKGYSELVKNNSKFDYFMKDYQDKIKKEIESKEKKSKIIIPSDAQFISNFYNKCKIINSEFKAFFEFISVK